MNIVKISYLEAWSIIRFNRKFQFLFLGFKRVSRTEIKVSIFEFLYFFCILFYLIVSYCLLLYFILSYCILLYLIISYYILLYLIVLYCILLYLIVSYCILLFLIISYCILFYLIISYCDCKHFLLILKNISIYFGICQANEKNCCKFSFLF